MLDHRKFLAGDPATALLFVKFVRRYVWKFFRNESQVHEVSNSAIVEILTKLKAGNEPADGQTAYWVLNCSSNAVRRELTRLRNAATVTYESRLHSRDKASKSEAFRARLELGRLDRLLDECGERTRAFLEAKALGHTCSEIAAEHGLRPGSVRMTVSRARAQLRARLTAQEKLDLLIKRAEHLGLDRTRSS